MKRVQAWIVASGVLLGVGGFVTTQVPHHVTKGRIPEDAFEAKGVRMSLVPDYIIAYSRSGEKCGYVRKVDLFVHHKLLHSDRIEVVDESLTRTVGHMVNGRGFVPARQPDESVPKYEARKRSEPNQS